MAVRNYGGFGAGLAQGFGLVQGVQDRFDRNELAKDTLEAKVASDEATADFRTKQLGLQAEENQLRILSAAATAQATADNRKLTLDETIRRNKAEETLKSEKQAFEQDPNNPANVKLQLENDQRQSYGKKVEQAGTLDTLYRTLTSTEDYTPDTLRQVNELVTSLEGGIFDVGDMVSNKQTEGAQAIKAFTYNLSQDPTAQMTDDVTDAYGRALNLNRSANIGRNIGAEWSNAPEWIREDGNYKVSKIALANVRGNGVQPNPSNPGQQDVMLSATVYVEATNALTGDVQVYEAPLTGNRAITDGEAVAIQLSQVQEVAAAGHYMSGSISPQIRNGVRRARILQRFGDSDGDGIGSDGQAEFAKAVDDKVEIVRRAIQNGDNNTFINLVSSDEANALAGKNLTQQQIDEITARVQENLLFDIDHTPPQQSMRQFFEQTRADLSGLEMPAGLKYTDANLQGKDNVTLGDLYDLTNNQMVSQLNGIADDPKKLFRALKAAGKIK
jgi:hypothetical protein